MIETKKGLFDVVVVNLSRFAKDEKYMEAYETLQEYIDTLTEEEMLNLDEHFNGGVEEKKEVIVRTHKGLVESVLVNGNKAEFKEVVMK